MKLVRYADRRDLLERRDLSEQTFPEFMHHNEPGGRWWGLLYDRFPAFQVALLDAGRARRRGALAAGSVGRLGLGSAARLG